MLSPGCLGPPYLYTMILSIIFFVIYTMLNMVTVAADFELSPLAEGLVVACHSRTEVKRSSREGGGVWAPESPPQRDHGHNALLPLVQIGRSAVAQSRAPAEPVLASPDARPHSRLPPHRMCPPWGQVLNLVAKLVLLLADTALLSDIPRLQALVICLGMAAQLYVSLRWVSWKAGLSI